MYLDEQALRESGLAMQDTTGDTPIETLRRHRFDAEGLDPTRLGTVAQIVADAHRSSASHTMTKKQIVDLVVKTVKDGLVNVTDQ